METFLEILKQRKISINELSKQSGVYPTTIQKWLYKGVEPSLTNAEKVLNALGYRLKIEKK